MKFKWKPMHTYILIGLIVLSAGIWWYWRYRKNNPLGGEVDGATEPENMTAAELAPGKIDYSKVKILPIKFSSDSFDAKVGFDESQDAIPWDEFVNRYFKSRTAGVAPADIVRESIKLVEQNETWYPKFIEKVKNQFGGIPGAMETMLVWEGIGTAANLRNTICRNVNYTIPTPYTEKATPGTGELAFYTCIGIDSGSGIVEDDETIIQDDGTLQDQGTGEDEEMGGEDDQLGDKIITGGAKTDKKYLITA